MPGAKVEPHPNWQPRPFITAWDDLMDGVKTRADWEQKRKQIKKRFLELLRDEAAPPVPKDLDVKVHKEWDAGGFTLRRISYNVESNERAHAFVAIPHTPRPAKGFPGVLCIHGTINYGARMTVGLGPESGDPHADKIRMGLDYGRVLARNGYVTISPEHFCCATRLPKEGPYDTAAFYRKHPNWSAIGKSTFENHVALNVLAAMPEVDSTRLGAVGLSLGGHNTVFIAAYDERVKCAVPIVGGTTINENPEILQWSRDYWYIYIPQIREQILKGQRIQCDFHEMMALAAPCPMLEFFSLNDGDAQTQAHRTALHVKVHEVYRVLEREEAHAFVVGGDGHSMPDLTRAGMVSWMDRWLKHDGNPNGAWDATPAVEK